MNQKPSQERGHTPPDVSSNEANLQVPGQNESGPPSLDSHSLSKPEESLNFLKENGFEKTFQIRGQFLHCLETGVAYAPQEVVIVERYRFEGVSDPDDSSILFALQTRDDTRGSLYTAYGVYANASEAEVLNLLPDAGRDPTITVTTTPAR